MVYIHVIDKACRVAPPQNLVLSQDFRRDFLFTNKLTSRHPGETETPIRTQAGPPSVCTEAAASDATTSSATSKKSKKCDHGARGPKVHGGVATKTDIMNAFLTVKPGLGLTSWKFENEHEFKMFIDNGNAEILRSLGYTTEKCTSSERWVFNFPTLGF